VRAAVAKVQRELEAERDALQVCVGLYGHEQEAAMMMQLDDAETLTEIAFPLVFALSWPALV
jgi:hypothetical protein